MHHNGLVIIYMFSHFCSSSIYYSRFSFLFLNFLRSFLDISSIMSTLGGNNNSGSMGSPFFHELKKQTSFFFKEKIKTARLALTDVTPVQLLTEEATNGNPWSPDTQTLKTISKAAFEVDDYWRIVEILHKRLVRFDTNNWRLSYKALIVLEYLLTHGPESVAEEFKSDKDVIWEMASFHHIDEKGFNWGLNVRKKSERILKLLEKVSVLKEERDRARKLSRGIEGFGSFSERTSSAQVILTKSERHIYGRCNSEFINHRFLSSKEDEVVSESKLEISQQQTHEENVNLVSTKKMENSNSMASFCDDEVLEKFGARMGFNENMAAEKEVMAVSGESLPLLGGQKDDPSIGMSTEEDHPFSETEHKTTVSLLSNKDQMLQAC